MSDIPEINYADHVTQFTKADVTSYINRAYGNFDDSSRGLKVKPPFSRQTYESFRPNEAIPSTQNQDSLHQIILACLNAYQRVGVIKSVIDMMADYTVDGLEIVHEDAGPNAFYQAWFKRTKLRDRATQFAEWAYKGGNVVVRRKLSTINKNSLRRMIKELKLETPITTNTVQIPTSYVFYNPAFVELIGDHLAVYSDNKKYGIKIGNLNNFVLTSKAGLTDSGLLDSLPQELQDAIQQKPGTSKNTVGKYVVPIPNDRIYIAHYKKDDHEIWALPIIYSVLEDVYYNAKLKQAKTSTLDDMINAIRIWKLGDHNKDILVAPAMANKLADILSNHTGGGGMDIIWDSMIELQTHYPPIDSLANFHEDYHAILIGLSVPETLLGGSTEHNKGASTVSNMGFKNMIKRLEYGREMLVNWISAEIDIIQKEMGFRKRPYIRFANEDLHDERTYYNLILQLLDRNVISQERVLEIIDEIPELENKRIKVEETAREAGEMPQKSSPFHNPDVQNQRDHELKMMAKTARLNSSNESNRKTEPQKTNGRPPGSKDSVQRKRGDKKTGLASATIYAQSAYDIIGSIVSSTMMEKHDIKNVRSMTGEQRKMVEDMQLFILSQLQPFDVIDRDKIVAIAANESDDLYNRFVTIFNDLLSEVPHDEINNDKKRAIVGLAYAQMHNISE